MNPKTVRTILITIGFILTVIGLGACAPGSKPSSQVQDIRHTEDQQQIYAINQPVPSFTFSQDRDTLIQIYRLRNEARATYTVVTSQGTGQVIFSCPSRGYAIPADTQLTNPVQPYGSTSAQYPLVTIEQPEPNGLYSSKNTDGTWILCVRPDGTINPVYTELKVSTFPYEVNVSDDKMTVTDSGQPSSTLVTIKPQPVQVVTPVPSPSTR